MIKQKDIITIVVVALVAAIISVIASSFVFSTKSSRNVQVEVVPAISANFPNSNSNLFENKNVDPTVIIQLGGPNNTNPFNNNGK